MPAKRGSVIKDDKGNAISHKIPFRILDGSKFFLKPDFLRNNLVGVAKSGQK